MEQEDITKIYETLAPMAGQYANAQAEQIGQAQQSMGPMAANVMGQSQTSGLGNYTYNRLMRPQVDVMRDEILVEGYRNQLNRALSDAYNTARKNYSRSSSGSGSGSGNNTSGSNGKTGVTTIGDVINKSTGSGKTTTWTALPNSYQWQDDDGNWHTAVRDKSFRDEDWLRFYEDAKNKYAPQGRFKG